MSSSTTTTDPSNNPANWKRLYTLIDDFSKKQDCEPFREPVPWKALGLTDYPILIPQPMDFGTIKKRLKANTTSTTTNNTQQQQQQPYYTSYTQCYNDIRLIWNNCMTYNADGSDFYKIAQSLSKKFDTIYNKFIHDIGATTTVVLPTTTTSSSSSTTPATTTTTTSGPSSIQSSTTATGVQGTASSSSSTTTTTGGATMNDRKVTLQEKRTLAKSFYTLSKEDLGKVLIEIEKRCPNAIKRNATEDELDLNMDLLDVPTMQHVSNMVNTMKNSGSSKKKPSQSSGSNKSTSSTTNGTSTTGNNNNNNNKKAKVESSSSSSAIPSTK